MAYQNHEGLSAEYLPTVTVLNAAAMEAGRLVESLMRKLKAEMPEARRVVTRVLNTAGEMVSRKEVK